MTEPSAEDLREPINFARDKADFDASPFHKYLGLTRDALTIGVARLCLTTGESTPRGIGNGVHGGVLAAIVDIAILRAVRTTLRSNDVPGGTASLQIDYLTPT